MAYRIYNSVDMVVILNDVTWEVEKSEKGGIRYTYNNLEAPISYTILQRSPERPLVLHQPYTEFKDKEGNGFDNDADLQLHLDEVLAAKELDIGLETIPYGPDRLLAVKDEGANELLKGILIELKINNKHLACITGEELTELDIND
jgi:hypothetical protein